MGRTSSETLFVVELTIEVSPVTLKPRAGFLRATGPTPKEGARAHPLLVASSLSVWSLQSLQSLHRAVAERAALARHALKLRGFDRKHITGKDACSASMIVTAFVGYLCWALFTSFHPAYVLHPCKPSKASSKTADRVVSILDASELRADSCVHLKTSKRQMRLGSRRAASPPTAGAHGAPLRRARLRRAAASARGELRKTELSPPPQSS